MPEMKDRLRKMLKRARKEGLERSASPEGPRGGEEPPRPRVAFRLPFLKNRGEKAVKRAEEAKAERKTRPTPRLVLGLLVGTVVLGTFFLVSRPGGGKPEPPAPPPLVQEAVSPSPAPMVGVVPTTPEQGGVSLGPAEVSPAPAQPKKVPKSVVPPTPKKARNPFGDPESGTPEASETRPSPNPSARPGLPPPPPTALGGLPPFPPPVPGIAQGDKGPAGPPPPPEVACLAVFLGKEGSAVVKAARFEGVVSVGEEVPGVGKLIEVSPNGCVISVGDRKLEASLEGDRRWK